MSKPLDEIDDFPMAVPSDTDPKIFKAYLLQVMSQRYKDAVPDLEAEGAYAAAVATWETEWPDDPSPRTVERAKEAVDDDLTEWVE